MKSSFYHIQINIDFANKSFYHDLMQFLGWSIIFETEDTIGYKSGENGDIWFVDAEKKNLQDYDALGMNHLAIRVAEQSNIDKVAEFLLQNDIASLFETPKHRDDFVDSTDQTYYQVMFKTADNILFEIVYIGAKS